MGRPRGSKNVPWDSIIQRLREHPGRWMLLPEMRSVPTHVVEVIRKQRRRQLRLDDGKVYCRVRAYAVLDDGKERCTLMLRFVPKE